MIKLSTDKFFAEVVSTSKVVVCLCGAGVGVSMI